MPPTATTSGARSACRRTSSRPRGRHWSTRSSAGCSRRGPGPTPRPAPPRRDPPHPAREAGAGARAGRAVAALEELGRPRVEAACDALGAGAADGTPVGARGHLAAFGFYANKQLTTGEGGMVTSGDPAVKERIDSERNQGRAPDMDWLDHDRLGFNYRLSDLACALGLAQLRRLDELLAARAGVADAYRAALAGIEGLDLPCRDRAAHPR